MRANLDALRVLRATQVAGRRVATESEQAVLGRWSGWGAVPQVFDENRPEFAAARIALGELLGPGEYAAAARNTLNAHYTDPALVAPIWSALEQLGFTGGRVLEPGVGSGNFIGLAPPNTDVVGVELDPVTAGIATLLYPNAQILTESFADTRAPEGSFDLVVGNVPFAKVALSDPRHNRGRHSLHNHFIIKSLHLVAPGGLVAVITSRYTMDAANPAARREIAALADLVGAIRLPASAHQQTAGTKVVTDLLVLRRREPDFEPAPTDWELTELAQLPALDGADTAETVRVNSYFLAHPEMVCGQLGVGRGQFSNAELTVRADRPAPALLAESLAVLVTRARQADLTHQPRTPFSPRRAALVGRAANLADGHIAAAGTAFTQVNQGAVGPFAVPATQRTELAALLGLRDGVVALLAAEAATMDDTTEIAQLRTDLNTAYDAYLTRWGPINRFSWHSTGRTDPETGEPALARATPRQGGFRADPHAPLVYALEDFDSSTQRASKAAILSQRVIAPRTPRLGADTPADALAICLDSHGRVELDEIARLLGIGTTEARDQLDALVFDEPSTAPTPATSTDTGSSTDAGTELEVEPDVALGPPRLVPAAEYLSGNVREKLAAATAAAAVDPRFASNVAALRQVMPPDLAPEDIRVQLGAPWISQPYIQQFLRETFADRYLVAEHAYGVSWTVKGRDVGVAATDTWGTPDMPAPQLAQTLLRQLPVIVRDEIDCTLPDGTETTRRVLNPAKTAAAQAKAEELSDRFTEWVWQDLARAVELARVYNTTFNSLVLRTYDDIALSLPGVALSFTPRPHQVAAVARMIAEPAVGLWHEVGAGKTAEMAMGVMELRRLGLVSKPAIVIPNHMIEQFTREFGQIYPGAKLLAASSDDLRKDRRRRFVARIATGDWDAVIITRGAFERIPMSPQAHGEYLDAQQEQLRTAIERQQASGERSFSLKRMQRALLEAEERAKERMAHDYDPAVTFETTGIDYLCVDEAHDYKNLNTPSNVPGGAIRGSARASDLEMKLHYLRRQHPGGHVATFATATPIANSITETHVMCRYLRPDLLDAAGVTDFDSWAATFGQTITEVELSPDGGDFKLKPRFARFHNVPELLRQWWVFGDVKTADDLKLPRPELVVRPDGRREAVTVTVAPSEELAEFIDELGARAELVATRAVEPDVDNMLKIAGEGRAAALDLRLIGRAAPPGESKLDVAADRIADIWARHRDDRFTGPDGKPHPTPGALQIVFCDLGTPSPGRWNVYDELRTQLVGRGLPADGVRFVQSARNDREKAELFAAARAGQVAVLIGSTATMGVGTNVQARAVALHDLDCPWRPADLAQRAGRILRQGNQYREVEIYRYVVEGSFDAYSWQTVSRKAGFIDQLMRGRLDVREIDDIGDSALSFSEIKALAAGNPLLLDKAKADAELTRLERLDRAHTAGRSRLRYLITQHQDTITRTTGDVDTLTHAINARRDTRGEHFAITIDGLRFTDRADAGHALRSWLQGVLGQPGPSPITLPLIARLGGHTFDATIWRGHTREYELTVTGIPTARLSGTATTLAEAKPASLVVRMENQLDRFERLLADARTSIDTSHDEISRAQAQLTRPFSRTEALAAARQTCAELDQALAELAAPPPAADASGTGHNAPADPATGRETEPGLAALAVLTPPPGHTHGRAPSTPTRPPNPPHITRPTQAPGRAR